MMQPKFLDNHIFKFTFFLYQLAQFYWAAHSILVRFTNKKCGSSAKLFGLNEITKSWSLNKTF